MTLYLDKIYQNQYNSGDLAPGHNISDLIYISGDLVPGHDQSDPICREVDATR